MKLDLKKNFDFNKIKIDQMSSAWLNILANHINVSIQEGLDKSVDLDGKPFAPVSEFTKSSIQDGKPHKKPLVRSGRMSETRKLPSTPTKLTFIIKGGILKSKKRWNIVVDGKKSSGTRETNKINYGALHNKGYTTDDNSMIPNKKVEEREWFGIPDSFDVGGKDWNIMVTKFMSYMHKYVKITMKEHK